jgi:hypothetical protein
MKQDAGVAIEHHPNLFEEKKIMSAIDLSGKSLSESVKPNLSVVKTEEQKAEERKAAKQAEKDRKKQEQYWRSMINRLEAHQIAQDYAMSQVKKYHAEVVKDALTGVIATNLALVELLKDSGIIKSDEQLTEYLEKVRVKAEAQETQEGKANANVKAEAPEPTQTKEVKES